MTKQGKVNWSELKILSQIHYGFEQFRPGQERVVEAAMEGQDTIVIMPTGSGKSLCFQLPALALQGMTIVVSYELIQRETSLDDLERMARIYRERDERDRLKQQQVIEYAQARGCRWRYLLAYFGDTDVDFEACGHCDRCDPAPGPGQAEPHPLAECTFTDRTVAL